MLRHLATYGYRNLCRTRLRSTVTALSVALVVALYTVLASIGHSVTDQLAGVLERQQVDVVVQSRYASTPVASSLPQTVVDELAALEHVRSFAALAIGRKQLGADASVFVLGVSRFPEFASRLGLELVRGRPHRAGTTEMVIGERTARALELEVGDAFDLGEPGRWPVVGVYSTWLDFLNAGVVVDLPAAQLLAGRPDRVNMVFLSLDDPAHADTVSAQIVQAYPTLLATSSQRLPELIGPARTLMSFSRVVSGVTLVVALGIMLNTLTMAIGERTSEIGILGAIGWSRTMIVAALVGESLMLATAGALLGFAMAAPAMRLLQSTFTSVFMYIPTHPDPAVLFEAVAMAGLVGVASAVFPALYGTRLGLATAIRHG